MGDATFTVDLNADLGEGFGIWRIGDDEALLGMVTSANVACGFHAGDPAGLLAVCRMASIAGARVEVDEVRNAVPVDADAGVRRERPLQAGHVRARLDQGCRVGQQPLPRAAREAARETVTPIRPGCASAGR